MAGIRELAKQRTGIDYHGGKRALVHSRPTRRLHALQLDAFEPYLALIEDPQAEEASWFLSALTTHVTDFFRLPQHFELLSHSVLPQLWQCHARDRRIRIWSGGCASGEEPSSLAMTVLEALPTSRRCAGRFGPGPLALFRDRCVIVAAVQRRPRGHPLKAIVFDHYGPPEELKLQDVPAPVPAPHEVLIQVRAASLNAADWHIMRADPFIARLMSGLFKPKCQRLGADVAGVVEAVGSAVTRFKLGDEVFGSLALNSWGSYAEKVCAREDLLVLKPKRTSFEEAAAVPLAGQTALQALQDVAKLQSGDKVLINGASGGVGTFAVQIAKAMGAHVTAVCSSRNQELARKLGADHVLDYSQVDFTQQEQRYDVIFAANGNHSLAAYKRILTPLGRYVGSGGAGKQMAEAMFLGPWLSEKGGRKLGWTDMKPKLADLEFLRELLEAGKLLPEIDRRYSLAQVPEAIAYLEEGHARGKVVITL